MKNHLFKINKMLQIIVNVLRDAIKINLRIHSVIIYVLVSICIAMFNDNIADVSRLLNSPINIFEIGRAHV